MNIKTYLSVKVHNQNGVLILDRPRFETNSLLGNFTSWVFPQLFDVVIPNNGAQLQDIANAAFAPMFNNHQFQSDGPAGNDARGIIVGTGAAANTIDTFKMAAKIAHGNGAGQLQYGLQINNGPPAGGGGANPREFQLLRVFSNVSGGAILISEVGLYSILLTGPNTACLERSVVAPFNVPNLGSATVAWVLGLTI